MHMHHIGALPLFQFSVHNVAKYVRGENVDKDKLATGVVVAVLGEEGEPGKFYVKQMFYSAPGEPQPQRPLPEKGRYFV